MAERRLSGRNAKIAAILESGEGLKNFYRFIAQNEYINLHDACQIVVERPDATVCNTLEEWNAMGRRVIKGRKSIAYYDHDGYKQFVFDCERYIRGRAVSAAHLTAQTPSHRLGRAERHERLRGERAERLSEDPQRRIYLSRKAERAYGRRTVRPSARGGDRIFALLQDGAFRKTQNIRLHGLPYSYRENAAFVKELYIRSELLAEEIEEAYQSKQSGSPKSINDIDEETVSDEPVVQSEPAEYRRKRRNSPNRALKGRTRYAIPNSESGNLAPEQGAAVQFRISSVSGSTEARPESDRTFACRRLLRGDWARTRGQLRKRSGSRLRAATSGFRSAFPCAVFPCFASDAYMERSLKSTA